MPKAKKKKVAKEEVEQSFTVTVERTRVERVTFTVQAFDDDEDIEDAALTRVEEDEGSQQLRWISVEDADPEYEVTEIEEQAEPILRLIAKVGDR